MTAADLLPVALEYAEAGWAVFPLKGKIPAIAKAAGGNGVLDATTDPTWLAGHWRPGWNIGGRVPDGLVVVDTDPRHGGEDNLQALARQHGSLPATLTAMSGRGDGGRHRYYQSTVAKPVSTRLPPGVDLKTPAGYCVLPPSVHPDSGGEYRWVDPQVPIVALPKWLTLLLRPAPPVQRRQSDLRVVRDDDSIADWFTRSRTWQWVLHGWTPIGETGWRHPHATSPLSATVRHDCLFVYSPNAGLPVTEAGDPHGLTRFRAWAHLEHGGNLAAAARAAKALRSLPGAA